jgi:serine protease
MRALLRRTLPILAALLLMQGLGAAHAAGPQRTQPLLDSSSTQARVIVKYRSQAAGLSGNGGVPQLAAHMGPRLGVNLADGRAIGHRSQVLRAEGLSSRVLAEKLAADSEVEWAVVDGRRFALAAPNDPLYADNQGSATPVAGQWYLRANTGTVKAALDVEPAWALTQGNSTLVVAVLDTGVVKTHPDLAAKLLAGYDFVSDPAAANDGGGRDADPSDPGDWISSSEDASGSFAGCGAGNSSWHGTQTASLIGAATNNGIGMAGVAPNVMLLPLRVLGKCGGYDSDIIAAMRWAAGLSVSGVPANPNPARVLNLSLGGTGTCSRAYQEAVSELTAANVAVVAAAGNEGLAVGMPANCSGVIAVAGVRQTGSKVGYSSLGPEVAISAPAGNCVNATGSCLYSIITATNTGTTVPVSSTYSNGSNYSVGTSFSAPLVAGTVALMLSANSSLTPGEVTSLLKNTARAFPASGAGSGVAACLAPSGTAQTSECYCTTSTCGAGLLDAGAAVAAAVAADVPTPVLTASAAMVLAGETISLSAAGSSAPAGRSIAAYRWEISSGADLASFSGGTTSASASLLAGAEGTVTVRLTVTDSAGQSAVQSTTLRIAAGLPTASFTVSSSTPTVGELVALDGSASSARGAASVSAYLWEITSGTGLASLAGSATTTGTSLNTTAAGSVVLRLTVTDSNGYSHSSSQTLSLLAPAAASTTTSGSATNSASGTSGGGGGAFSPLWGLGLLLAAGLLRRRRER